jgi:hypothetical protein
MQDIMLNCFIFGFEYNSFRFIYKYCSFLRIHEMFSFLWAALVSRFLSLLIQLCMIPVALGRFHPSTSVSPPSLHSTKFSNLTITLGWYNRPEVADVPSEPSLDWYDPSVCKNVKRTHNSRMFKHFHSHRLRGKQALNLAPWCNYW